jgi:hypothetical protein
MEVKQAAQKEQEQDGTGGGGGGDGEDGEPPPATLPPPTQGADDSMDVVRTHFFSSLFVFSSPHSFRSYSSLFSEHY